MTKRKLFLIDCTIDHFRGTKLPNRLELLQRYYHLINLDKIKHNPAICLIIKEVSHIWSKANLATQAEFTIKNKVNKLVREYKLKKKSEYYPMTKAICEFKSSLINLFDIANECPSKIKEDLEFLVNQRHPSRTGSIRSLDTNFVKRSENNLKRKCWEQRRIEKEAKRKFDAANSSIRIDELILDEKDGEIDQLAESVMNILESKDKDFKT